MDHDQFGKLISKGHIAFNDMTEKTDGSAHLFGHDEHGFYSQYTGSGNERMRSPQDFVDRAKRRSQETGKPLDLGAANTFGHIHSVLQSNKGLQDHIKKQYEKTGKDVQVKGEMFYKPNAKPSDVPGEIKFVGTSYDPKHMGSVGKYVIHTKLPENQEHNVEHFKKHLSNSEINFDDDKIAVKSSELDVSSHHEAYKQLNHELLGSRTTKTNKAAKEAEQAKLSEIQHDVSNKVDEHVKNMNLHPRWGSGSEGIVVHPSDNQPRFKITSNTFREYRDSDAKDFKKSLVKESIRIIMEGGNIKIGNVSAAPFKVTDRSVQADHIHNALSQMHDEFHEKTGKHLFGKGKKALSTGSTFAGSTKQLMDKSISDKEFTKHKPSVGDVDIQVTHEHKNALSDFMMPGRKFGKYTVVGTKKHGNENSAVMRHEDTGEHHQFDFEGVEYKDHEPTKGEQFLHSSSWEDSKAGVKGAHHKILLNAVGLDTHKFSITHGLRSRIDEKDPGEKEPEGVAKRLFGNKADSSRISSFHGVADLISRHLPKEDHQKIYDKFKDSVSKAKMTGSDDALEVLRKKLNLKDTMNEETTEENSNHVHMSYLGASPITHMGHHIDVVGSMNSVGKVEDPKFVGLSGKSQIFSNKEREDIADKQSGGAAKFNVVHSPGVTIAKAYEAVSNNEGNKILHLHFGHDRKEFAERLKKSIEDGKIPELQGNKFDKVHIHYPEDGDRSHGMSGTKMRAAAHEGNIEEFRKHLGPNFSQKEAEEIRIKVKKAPLLREERKEYNLISFMEYMETTEGVLESASDQYMKARKELKSDNLTPEEKEFYKKKKEAMEKLVIRK
jgi:hypothetical protein